MKTLLIIGLIILCKVFYAQECTCELNPELAVNISCKAVVLNNQSKIYWQYNCDSSWLTFKNSKGLIKILYSLERALMDYTGRLGFSYAAEYKSTFLIQNNVISGCCDPPEFILFDKANGKEKINLGRLVFYSEFKNYPFVVYFENNKYAFEGKESRENNLILRNIDNNKTFKIKLPSSRIKTTMAITEENFPEHLIDETKIINGLLLIKYRYKIRSDEENWLEGTIKIKLAKYR